MAIRSGNIGVNVNPLCLGQRTAAGAHGHATDAAALAAWQTIAARSSEPGLSVSSNPPGGAYYRNTTTNRIRFADGAGGWSELAPAGDPVVIAVSAAITDAAVNITYDAAVTNDAILVLMDNSAASARAVVLDTNKAFSAPLLQIISDTATPTAACIDVAGTGIGAAGVGAILNVASSGALVAGARTVRIVSTGNFAAADCHTVHIEHNTGAGVVGNHALYINATGANGEAIRVDAGTCTFDEALTVGTAANGIAMNATGSSGVTYAGTSLVTKRLYLPAASGAAGPDGVAGSTDFQSNKSFQLSAAATDSVRFAIEVPWDYEAATEMQLNIKVSRAADAGADDVVLRVDYAAITNGGSLSTINAGTQFTATLQAGANNLTLVSNAQAIIPAGAGATVGSQLFFDVVRLGGDAADTCPEALELLGVRLSYSANRA